MIGKIVETEEDLNGWIGIDLDGTLANYEEGGSGNIPIGTIVPAMEAKVREYLAQGIKCKLFTARCGFPDEIPKIEQWLAEHNLSELEITNIKDHGMKVLYDDRCAQVVVNTGMIIGSEKYIPGWNL